MRAKDAIAITDSATQEAVLLARKSRRYVFVIYRDYGKLWRWRLVSPNGRIVADSGESYKQRGGCMLAVKKIREKAQHSAIHVKERRHDQP